MLLDAGSPAGLVIVGFIGIFGLVITIFIVVAVIIGIVKICKTIKKKSEAGNDAVCLQPGAENMDKGDSQ